MSASTTSDSNSITVKLKLPMAEIEATIFLKDGKISVYNLTNDCPHLERPVYGYEQVLWDYIKMLERS